MSYKMPISVIEMNNEPSIIEKIGKQVAEEQDRRITYAVSKTMGFDIDKDELAKALKYDRNQYEKGYNDAMETIKAENERLNAKLEMALADLRMVHRCITCKYANKCGQSRTYNICDGEYKWRGDAE